jgi:hypothetical protein
MRATSLLRTEPEYVRKRYQAVSSTLALFGATRRRAAEMIGRSKRQLQRIVKRFKEEEIAGLRHRSKRPRTTLARERVGKERFADWNNVVERARGSRVAIRKITHGNQSDEGAAARVVRMSLKETSCSLRK